MSDDAETLDGYVVDIVCLRRYCQAELLDRAREHTTDCSLRGHCIESGYGLVTSDGRVQLLDPAATPQVVRTLRQSTTRAGARLRAHRHCTDGEMLTTDVTEI